jgi:hypothetical protein
MQRSLNNFSNHWAALRRSFLLKCFKLSFDCYHLFRNRTNCQNKQIQSSELGPRSVSQRACILKAGKNYGAGHGQVICDWTQKLSLNINLTDKTKLIQAQGRTPWVTREGNMCHDPSVLSSSRLLAPLAITAEVTREIWPSITNCLKHDTKRASAVMEPRNDEVLSQCLAEYIIQEFVELLSTCEDTTPWQKCVVHPHSLHFLLSLLHNFFTHCSQN